jgi:hypothetical protein
MNISTVDSNIRWFENTKFNVFLHFFGNPFKMCIVDTDI